MRIAIMSAGIVTLCACTSPAPNVEARFGNAVRAAVAQQTLNPEASHNTNPVTGIDGTSAQSIIERYEEGSRTPPAPVNVFNIGVGGTR